MCIFVLIVVSCSMILEHVMFKFVYSLLRGHIFNAHNSWLLENDSECAVIQYTSGLPWGYLGIWGDTMDAHRQLEAWTL